jgi:DNA-directed RNA polymerase specialized sigma24 family protein
MAMWSFLRLRLWRRTGSARSRGQALGCLPDLYRIAYFLVGNQPAAEEMVESTYEKAWREHVAGRRIGNWRLHLLRALLEQAERLTLAGIDLEPEKTPPLWEVLSKLEFQSRIIILLDALDIPAEQIARIANSPEALAAQRIEAVREDFRKHFRVEIN